MERFTPLYAIACAIMNGTDNLRYLRLFPRFSFLYGYFYKRNLRTVVETLVKVRLGKREICLETLALWARVPTSISRSLKLPLVFL